MFSARPSDRISITLAAAAQRFGRKKNREFSLRHSRTVVTSTIERILAGIVFSFSG